LAYRTHAVASDILPGQSRTGVATVKIRSESGQGNERALGSADWAVQRDDESGERLVKGREHISLRHGVGHCQPIHPTSQVACQVTNSDWRGSFRKPRMPVWCISTGPVVSVESARALCCTRDATGRTWLAVQLAPLPSQGFFVADDMVTAKSTPTLTAGSPPSPCDPSHGHADWSPVSRRTRPHMNQ
jgi:hypothetical protein